MIKDKFVLGMIIATILIFVGGAFFISKKDIKTIENTQKVLEVTNFDYIKGNKDASVTIIEYLDFECPACGAYYPLVKELSEKYKDDVRFVVRYFPLMGHKNGLTSAYAVEASSKQGKFWEMYDVLFENQKSWAGKESADPTIFENYAGQIGLNIEQFKKDRDSKEVKDRVNNDLSSGKKAGISGTPTFFLDGEKIPNPKTIEDFKTFIDAAILKAPKQSDNSVGEKVHEHADLTLYINDKKILLQSRPEFFEKDPDIHSHKDTEEIIHKHKTGATLAKLVDSWKTNLPKNVSWYLNDTKQENDFRKYEFKDLDRIVLSFSDSNSGLTEKQISDTTDKACIYSEKCPERGKPPTEECVGGLGTDCI